MKFSIIKPLVTEVLKTEWIEIPTDQGKFIVEKEHMPMIVFLNEKEKIQVKLHDNSIIDLPLYGGIVKIDRDHVTLIVTHE